MRQLLLTVEQAQALWESCNPGRVYSLPQRDGDWFSACEHGYEWGQGHECQQMRDYLLSDEEVIQ